MRRTKTLPGDPTRKSGHVLDSVKPTELFLVALPSDILFDLHCMKR